MSYDFPSDTRVHGLHHMQFRAFLQSSPDGRLASPLPQQHLTSPLDPFLHSTAPRSAPNSCAVLPAPLPKIESLSQGLSSNSIFSPRPRPHTSIPQPSLSPVSSRNPNAKELASIPPGFPLDYLCGPATTFNAANQIVQVDEGQYICPCGKLLAISSWAKNGKTHEASKGHKKALNIDSKIADSKCVHPCPGCGSEMRIDSLRRHVKGPKNGISPCKGLSLDHLGSRSRKPGTSISKRKDRTPLVDPVVLDESISPRPNITLLPNTTDPRSPPPYGTNGIEAMLAAASLDHGYLSTPPSSVHIKSLGLRISTNANTPRSGRSAVSPISPRQRYAGASPLSGGRPPLSNTASPRSYRSPLVNELYLSPIGAPPPLLLDTPASGSQSLLSTGTPYTPYLGLDPYTNSSHALTSLEDDDGLLLKNLPDAGGESPPGESEIEQGIDPEVIPPSPTTLGGASPFTAFEQQLFPSPYVTSTSPYIHSPMALPTQPPPIDAMPSFNNQGPHTPRFHPQHSGSTRNVAPQYYSDNAAWQPNNLNVSVSDLVGAGMNFSQHQPFQIQTNGQTQNFVAPMALDHLANPFAGDQYQLDEETNARLWAWNP